MEWTILLRNEIKILLFFFQDGSLVVCPILDARRNSYGTLAVDTVRTQNKETGIFLQHELAFVQVDSTLTQFECLLAVA